MDDLIARLEAATGPDRQLDLDIRRAVGPGDPTSFRSVPEYSASLDAALSLVPEGWTRSVDATVPRMGIDVCLFAENGSARDAVGVHKHEAIATCIAALKARRETT